MVSGILVFVVFLLALSGMIFVHELGHFLAARWAKVEVEEFGFGLPSYKLVTLFKWQGTEFTIHALPLGGFVRPKGENDPNVPGGLAAASPWKRLVVLFAGPLMNLFTAVVVFSLLIGMQGIATAGPIDVAAISPNSPAEQAGIQSGDVILALNGEEITEVSQAIEIIQANLDQPIQVELERGTEQHLLTATPLSARTRQEGALGVSLSPATRPATFSEIVTGGVTVTSYQVAAIAYLPVALIQGVVAPGEARVIGFKGIYDLFGVAVQEDVQSRQEAAATSSAGERPSNWTLNLIGVLSVSLGVMNLLPIPALDGGRILFTLPEILFRKRVPAEWENVVNGMAMLLLIVLMLFVNVMDFINPAEIPTP
jgi:regulator of sigma E protease